MFLFSLSSIMKNIIEPDSENPQEHHVITEVQKLPNLVRSQEVKARIPASAHTIEEIIDTLSTTKTGPDTALSLAVQLATFFSKHPEYDQRKIHDFIVHFLARVCDKLFFGLWIYDAPPNNDLTGIVMDVMEPMILHYVLIVKKMGTIGEDLLALDRQELSILYTKLHTYDHKTNT